MTGIAIVKKFRRGNEIIAIIEGKSLGNVIYQKWAGNTRIHNIVGQLEEKDLKVYKAKEELNDEEFEELRRKVMKNAVLW